MEKTRLNIEADERMQAEALNKVMQCIEDAERIGLFITATDRLLSFEDAQMIAKQGRSVVIVNNGSESATTTVAWTDRRNGRVTYLGKNTVLTALVDGDCLTVEDHCISENGTIDTNYTIENATVVAS